MDAGLRRFFRFVFLAANVVASCALAPMLAQAYGDRGATPGDFDYYVLAMSWSPTYCDSRGEGERRRCGRECRDRYDGGGYGGDRYDGGGYGGVVTTAADMAGITSMADRITIGTTTGEATAVEGGIPTSNAAARVRTPSFCMVFGRNMSAEAGRRCASPTSAHGCRRKRLIR